MEIPISQLPIGGAAPAISPAPAARASPNGHHPWNSPAAATADEFQSWWIHLWSGLVRDPTAKHYKAMGSAVWLYLFLLISANRSNGIVWRKEETICLQTGFSERTVARWLQELRDKGYILSINNGRSLRILITKWRPITGRRSPPKQN